MTKNPKTYKESFAKTDRLYNSPIFTMRRALNNTPYHDRFNNPNYVNLDSLFNDPFSWVRKRKPLCTFSSLTIPLYLSIDVSQLLTLAIPIVSYFCTNISLTKRTYGSPQLGEIISLIISMTPLTIYVWSITHHFYLAVSPTSPYDISCVI